LKANITAIFGGKLIQTLDEITTEDNAVVIEASKNKLPENVLSETSPLASATKEKSVLDDCMYDLRFSILCESVRLE